MQSRERLSKEWYSYFHIFDWNHVTFSLHYTFYVFTRPLRHTFLCKEPTFNKNKHKRITKSNDETLQNRLIAWIIQQIRITLRQENTLPLCQQKQYAFVTCVYWFSMAFIQSCLLFQLMREKSVWWNQEKTVVLIGCLAHSSLSPDRRNILRKVWWLAKMW